MANRIDFEAKSDRELLVLVAQVSNAINEEKLPNIVKRLDELSSTVADHSKRLIQVETGGKLNYQRFNRRVATIVTAITTGVCTFIFLLGRWLGWW